MKPLIFKDLPAEDRTRIEGYLNGSLSAEEFEQFQKRLLENADLRAVMRRYLALDESLRGKAEAAMDSKIETTADRWVGGSKAVPDPASAKVVRTSRWVSAGYLALAASVLFFIGVGALFLSLRSLNSGNENFVSVEPKQPLATGFAVIGHLFDVRWSEQTSIRHEGDTLGAEVFALASGSAEIQFFSGAVMMVEGPASISLKSAWEAVCLDGAVRMRVPPAARGFKLHAPSTEIVDLGTEFGLAVRDGQAQVEVFEGEIALHPKGEEKMLLQKGGALDLPAAGKPTPVHAGSTAFPNSLQTGLLAAQQQEISFAEWKAHRDALAKDPRLLLYYTFDRDSSSGLIPNLHTPHHHEQDGTVVLAESVDGRWAGMKSALEFRRPGARVRTHVPGEFSAFTFTCWVRIDSLDRWYNALYMADGYENGEPHWQIRNDGKMMLSVMVDDSRPLPGHAGSRYHHVYYSPSMWNPAMGGQWIHLASVFDPANRQVSHYVNGERLSREAIQPEFFVEKLRIGNGEVGNWGQPFREDPTWAIRNLNGRMDELAIFNAALSDEEIAELYKKSRSGEK